MAKCQQFTLYRAETDVPRGRALSTEVLQSYVDAVMSEPYFEANFPMVGRIEARSLPGGNASVGGYMGEGFGVIEMLPVHHCELFVLHELSHVLAEARYGSKSHDPWFARTYLELVSVVMGPVAYQALRDAFDADGIDHDVDSSAIVGIAL